MSSIGVDTGGTFTDLVYLRDDGQVEIAKRPSTPPNFSKGVLDVVEAVDKGRNVLSTLDCFYHGTTVATNAMINLNGVKIGFITTAGHRDALPIMRIIGRSAGRSEIDLKQYTYCDKPAPIVTKSLIKEVHERIDYKGRVVVPFNEDSARQAVKDLLVQGVEAIGVCFLWSFKHPLHERRMREIIEEMAPHIHISISSEIAPAVNEYERSATTAVNAYVAPLLTTYLTELTNALHENGLRSPLYVMQSMGGSMRAADAERRSVNTLASGPAGGVVATSFLGNLLGQKNIIAADVGGTSFDVGLVVDGKPIITSSSTVNQYTLLAPTIDIVSIGAGGGSIAWVDMDRLRVGPKSAGADPGPACYGRGGQDPTVTDADLVLGYIDPNYFLGGKFKLDRTLAEKAIEEKIARPLGMSVRDAASGIVEIVNQHMSDLIRKMTIERGYDPRDFVVYGFGGAGPLHSGAFGRELGVQEVIFPLGNISSAFSALGLAVSDVSTMTQQSDLTLAPFDPDKFTADFERLEKEAIEKLTAGGAKRSNVELKRVVELRYKGQVHQVDANVPAGKLTTAVLDGVIEEFEMRYEKLFGRGSGFREAGVELVTYRVIGSMHIQDASLKEAKIGSADSVPARIGKEMIYWREVGAEVETGIYGDGLKAGMLIEGPAIIRFDTTTGLIHPGQRAKIDGFGNVRITQG
ncbi:MAG: hydantoinase/oxoprolinase family protein [Rhizobiaceae bacterium]|nr:hydantoinase/oxoprolinase family protein [Rhizobiaceae bacterium]